MIPEEDDWVKGIFDMSEESYDELMSTLFQNRQEPRVKKKERPSYLEKLEQLPPCEGCGVIAGQCLCEIIEEMEKEEENDH